METITFHCKVITPMFLAGADGQTPELRAPSIKGAMRFWWRALNGHLVEEKNGKWDYSRLKEEEGKLFGSTTSRSPFSLEVNHISPLSSFIFKPNEFPNSVKYFMYSLIHHNEKLGISPGYEFEIIIRSRSIKTLLLVSKLIVTVTNLGGIGTRARRGAGAFSILRSSTKISKPENGEFSFLQETSNLNIDIINALRNPIPPREYSFDEIEHSNIPQSNAIYFSKKKFNRWENALNEIQKRMMLIRDGETIKNAENIKGWDSYFKEKDLDKKAAFGLPLNIRTSNTNTRKEDMVNLHTKPLGESELKAARRGSPLFISVLEQDGKYRWTCLHLKGKFMPEDSLIKFNSQEWLKVNPELIDKFLEELENDATDNSHSEDNNSVSKLRLK